MSDVQFTGMQGYLSRFSQLRAKSEIENTPEKKKHALKPYFQAGLTSLGGEDGTQLGLNKFSGGVMYQNINGKFVTLLNINNLSTDYDMGGKLNDTTLDAAGAKKIKVSPNFSLTPSLQLSYRMLSANDSKGGYKYNTFDFGAGLTVDLFNTLDFSFIVDNALGQKEEGTTIALPVNVKLNPKGKAPVELGAAVYWNSLRDFHGMLQASQQAGAFTYGGGVDVASRLKELELKPYAFASIDVIGMSFKVEYTADVSKKISDNLKIEASYRILLGK